MKYAIFCHLTGSDREIQYKTEIMISHSITIRVSCTHRERNQTKAYHRVTYISDKMHTQKKHFSQETRKSTRDRERQASKDIFVSVNISGVVGADTDAAVAAAGTTIAMPFECMQECLCVVRV